MPRRFSYPYALQLLFVLVVVLAALVLFVLLVALLAVILVHFGSPPTAFGVILIRNLQNIPVFPGKKGLPDQKPCATMSY